MLWSLVFLTAPEAKAQFTVPKITAVESTCQANGKVIVKGNVTYLNILTGGNIPGQLGPLSGSENDVIFTLLAPGNYTLTVIDPNTNEEKTYPVTVPGNYEQNWIFSAEVVYAPCSGGVPTINIKNLKILDADPSEQRPDYFFRISAKNGGLPSNGTEPPPYNTPLSGSFPIPLSGVGGTYEIQGRDACGNYKTINVTVPNSISGPSVSTGFVKFNNCNGDANYKISASGGTAPYIFKIVSGPDQVGTTVTDPSSATFALKAAGTYGFEVKDQCGGTTTKSVTVKAYTAPAVSIWSSYGECGPSGGPGTGAIQVAVDLNSVGIGPVTVALSSTGGCSTPPSQNYPLDGSGTVTFSGLIRPCKYTVTVTDGCNKVFTKVVELVGPGEDKLQCYKGYECPATGETNYRLKIGTFGTSYNAKAPFVFTIIDSTTNTPVASITKNEYAEIRVPLPKGKYYINIVDACGATCLDSVYMPKYALPTVSVDVNNRCFGSGQANVIGVNNREPFANWDKIYNYWIESGPSRVGAKPESDSPPNTGQFSGLISGGTYKFGFSDGCKTVYVEVTIPVYKQPTWEVGFGALCPPETVADLQIVNLQPAGKVVGPYKWRIISTDSQLYGSTPPYNGILPYPNSTGQEDSTFTNLPAKNAAKDVATYQILGSDGCKNSYQGSGKVGALPEESLILSTTTVCPDGSTELKARVSVPVVGATYRYYRDGIKVAESTKLFTTITPALPGSYTVKVIASTLPDSSCFKEAPAVVVKTTGTLVTTDPTPQCPEIPVNLTTTTAGSSSGTITFYRDKGFTQEETSPTAVTVAKTYYVKLVLAGNPSCILKDSVVVAFKSCKGSLGDFVWKDANNNGIQDLPSEMGVKGVIVQLLKASDNSVLATDTTDANGLYGFINLLSGSYKVKILTSSLPDTCQISPKQDVNTGGGNDTNDSDFNPTTGESQVVVIDATGTGINKDNPTIDAGLYVPCVKPTAGQDLSVCEGQTTVNLKDATNREAWSKGTQPANTSAAITASTGVVTGLSKPGDYYFILTYKGQVACTDTVKITVNARPVANATAKNQTICVGNIPATYTATPSTGVSYAWYGALSDTTGSLGTAISGQTAATFTPTGAAITTPGKKYYAVVVTNTQTSCKDTAFVSLTVNARPVAKATTNGGAKTQTICINSTPTAYIATPSTGVSYAWYGALSDTTGSLGTAISGQTAATFTPTGVAITTPGKKYYAVVVTNTQTSCKDTAFVSLIVLAKPSVATAASTVCENAPGSGLGTFNLTSLNSTIGGTNNVAWFSNAARTAAINTPTSYVSTSGKAYAIVTNPNTSCSDTTSVSLTVQGKPTDIKTETSCVATANGSGKIVVTATAPASNTLEYKLNVAGTYGSSATFDGVTNGNHTVYVRVVGSNCYDSTIVNVNCFCTQPTLTVVNPAPVCFPATVNITGSNVITANTGVRTNYWKNANLTQPLDATTGPATAIKLAGTYYIKSMLADSACFTSKPIIVTINPLPVVKDTTLTRCDLGGGKAVFDLKAIEKTVNGSTNNTVAWFSNKNRTVVIPTPEAYLSGNGIAYVQITNPTTNCSDTTSVRLVVAKKPNVGVDSVGVAGICNTVATINLPDAAPGESWAQLGSSPKVVTINATTGVVIGMDAIGIYQFILKNTTTSCADTVSVEVKNCLKGSIGDYVWKDSNDNGLQDSNEKGVKGVVVQLLNGDTNALISTDTTDSNGLYGFLGLDSGNYKVKIVPSSLPDTCQITTKQNAGSPNDDTKDSDFNPTTGESPVIVINTLGTGIAKDNPTIDAGLVNPCIKPKFTLTKAPVCSADVQTYSLSFSVAGKNGTIKVSTGTLTGANPYNVTGVPSGTILKITDSLSAVCKFDTLIVGPNCNCNPALPVLITPSLTACIGDTFPTIKASVVGLATVEWFADSTGGTALFTGLNYKPAGTVTGDETFYAQARSTDPSCPTAISTSRVAATVKAKTCIKIVDLALKKLIDKKIASIGDTVEYTIKVWNESATDATGVEVTDSLNAGVQYVSSSAVRIAGGSAGTYNPANFKWTIGNVAANGDTVALTIRVKVLAQGVWFNTAEITNTNEKDVDSTPGNGKENEDDLDRQCFTVPFKLCAGESVEVSVPAKYKNVQWFKQGSSTSVGSGNTILLTDVGTYTYTASNNACPATGCCPIIIQPGDNCCPAELCIPFIITKTKTKVKK